MRLIHPYNAHLMIGLINHGEMVGVLKDLQAIARKHEGQSVRPTLVARIVKAVMGLRHVSEFLDDVRCAGLQNGIVVIADKHQDVADAVRPPRKIDKRSGTRTQRLKARKPRMCPDTGEIWN